MRLAVISDVHGNLVALETVLADIDLRAPDAIVNLGDCVTSPLWPRETLELLETLELPTVRGNHDRVMVEEPKDGVKPSVAFTRESLTAAQRQRLASLPAALALTDDIFAVHGTPANDSTYLLEDKEGGRLARATRASIDERLGSITAGLILCGHSHQQHAAIASGNRLVVNPGSVGCPRYADDEVPELAEAGSPHARYALLTLRGRRWSVEFYALAYDWDLAAQRARDNDRPDWARGFLGGWDS
jgi:predicted phosphodiesterase